METPLKNWFRYYGWVSLFAIITVVGICLDTYMSHKEASLTNEKLLKSQSLNDRCSQTRDSLFRANAELSKYKTLSLAMAYRDGITSQLNHKVGDLVRLKSDSSKVVIEDIVIGGGKYNYYVKYRVVSKDNTSREMVPELIY